VNEAAQQATPGTGARAQPVLEIEGLYKHFGGIRAVNGATFSVADGSITALIGPNGAGKTTLFNVVSGFVRPSSGSLMWQDKEFRPAPDRLSRVGIVRTLQAVGLFGHLSAVENVMVGAATLRRSGFLGALFAGPGSGRDERRLRGLALGWLDRLGIAAVAERPAAALPYPVRKQVALARALIGRPQLLMLDEPAGGLGIEEMQPLAELIRALPTDSESPCAVLLVEHHMDLVMDVCQQVVVLDFGRKVAAGTPAQVKADPAVAAAYLGADVPDGQVEHIEHLARFGQTGSDGPTP